MVEYVGFCFQMFCFVYSLFPEKNHPKVQLGGVFWN
jgi:hypothetical protein